MEENKQAFDPDCLSADLEVTAVPLEAGTEIVISSKWRESDYFFVNLLSPSLFDNAEYSLSWLVQIGLESFAVLSYPPPVRAELETPIHFVLKIVERERLEIISSARLSMIANECLREMSRVARSEPGRFELVLGSFPTWEEHKEAAGADS